MSHRPFASFSIEQIESLFKSKGGSVDVLRDISRELSFRTTDRAKALAKRVDHQRRSSDLRQAAATSEALKPAESPASQKQLQFDTTVLPTLTAAIPFEATAPLNIAAHVVAP